MIARKPQRGFTLTEMMVVVAIIGVLISLAAVYLKPKVRAIDVAFRVGDLASEGSRRAVALGPVRADVAAALGITARVQLRAIAGPTFILERLQEDASPATTASWVEIQRYTVPATVSGDSWGTGIGAKASLTTSTTWTSFTMRCYPNGTCDPKSLFFQNSAVGGPTTDYQARLSVLPIGGAIMTRKDWN